jgi:hypothetical protein
MPDFLKAFLPLTCTPKDNQKMNTMFLILKKIVFVLVIMIVLGSIGAAIGFFAGLGNKSQGVIQSAPEASPLPLTQQPAVIGCLIGAGIALAYSLFDKDLRTTKNPTLFGHEIFGKKGKPLDAPSFMRELDRARVSLATPRPPQQGQSMVKESRSEFEMLIDLNDRWTRETVLKSMVAQPSEENAGTIQKAINVLTEGTFVPYRKKIDPLDAEGACQGVLYYARANVFKSDPYAVQALIPYVGHRIEVLSRQLRSMSNGERYFAVYQLLQAQLEISQKMQA